MTGPDMTPYASGHGRAVLVVVCLVLAILVETISGIINVMLVAVLSAGMGGRPMKFLSLQRTFLVVGGVASLQGFFILFAPLALVLWLPRVHRTLVALGARELEYSPTWAWTGFLLPVWNLVRPAQVLGEVWRASEPSWTDGSSWKGRPASPAIGWWWGMIISSYGLTGISIKLFLPAHTPRGAIAAAYLSLAADLCAIVAACLVIRIIREIDRRQAARHRLLGQPRGALAT